MLDLFLAAMIDGNYPQGVVFDGRFHSVERVSVTGHAPPGISAQTTEQTGTARIWHGAPDGPYLVSHAKGSYTQTQTIDGRSKTTTEHYAGSSEFDALGYSKHPDPDPSDIVPVFPGHAVGTGDTWSARVRVKNAQYGIGYASYAYRVTSIATGDGHTIATIAMTMHGDLRPPESGWSTRVAGHSVIVWDCDAHQRVRSHDVLTYTMTAANGSVVDASDTTEEMHRSR